MKIYIKYMVSLRCKLLVIEELKKLGLKSFIVELGLVELFESPSNANMQALKGNLAKSGLEILDGKKSILVENIKNVIVSMIHHSEELPKTNYSHFLSQQLGYDYAYLSTIFSEVKGSTIQQYIIAQKIEKVKEYLIYNEITLTEIAFRLGYSSVAHVSHQFKQVTGLTPTFYKGLATQRRIPIEDI